MSVTIYGRRVRCRSFPQNGLPIRVPRESILHVGVSNLSAVA